MAKTTLRPIPRESLIARTTEVLADLVLESQFKPGDTLPSEAELCRQLQVGRSTVREAVKTLESRGLVRRVQGVGIKVVDESDRAAAEVLSILFRRTSDATAALLEARTVLEVEYSKLAAERADADDLRRMEEAIEPLKDSHPNRAEAIDAALNFHVALAQATHNQVFVLIAETLKPLLQEALDQTLEDKYPTSRDRHYHEEVVWAIRRHNPQQAADAMTRRLRRQRGAGS